MAFDQAQALARVVTEEAQSESIVVPDGEWFAVAVTSSGGTWSLADEADWVCLRSQIQRGSEPER